jgi:hypothetical protein
MFYKKIETPIIILLIILSGICFYKYIYDGTDYVKSNLDERYYKVRSKEGKEEKADLLAIIYIKLNTIVNSLEKSNYSSNENVKRLIENWKKGVTVKEIGKMESDAAYVINKQYMSFCLPDNTSKTIDDLNLMTYVGIHELAHIMSIETGHGNEFIGNFEFLLNYSKTLIYYDPLLKTNLPVYIQLNKLNTADNYCGVSLVNSIK